MHLLGITGGIGMGKSAAQDLLREKDVPVVDTDWLAHELVAPGQPALHEIVEAFGRELLDGSGCLRRGALASLVFSNSEARARLESILHPRIRRRWMDEAESWRGGGARLGAVVIPLLFETGAEASFDIIICVACGEATQHHRLTARGWDSVEISRRIAAQWPVERKMAAADYVVWTEGDMDLHRDQWARVIGAIEIGV